MITPRTPPGVLELLPRQQIAFQNFLKTIRKGFERFGFLPIETPVFEFTDILLTKEGGETEKQVYFVQSTGAIKEGHKPELALRYDLTVPLARYVAEHERDLAFPFRRYQIQRSYRGERSQRGRFREFYQCDIDVIGKDTLPLAYDAELASIGYFIFRDLKVDPFTIHLNNRKLIAGLFEGLGIPTERHVEVMHTIDKMDKMGSEKVLKVLTEPAAGLSEAQAKHLFEVLMTPGSTKDVLKKLKTLKFSNALFTEGLKEIESVLTGMAALGVPESVYHLNLLIVRGLDYYTGIVYEGRFNDDPAFGSICSGGRYENLASHYTRSHLPGIGFSIGATRVFSHMLGKGRFADTASTCQVLVTMMDEKLEDQYRALASELRAGGINTEMYMEPAKLTKQIKYADRAGIPFILVIGSDEASRQTVTLKDLRTGEQKELSRTDLALQLVKTLK